MKIAISAAETSGDLLAAHLMDAIKILRPEVVFEGLAGAKMRASGCSVLWDNSQTQVMGFVEVVRKIPKLMRLQNAIIRHFSAHPPDIFIAVDAPDFHLKIERKLRKIGIKVVHFVSPSLWAWRPGRVKKIKQSNNLVLCLFPFEIDFYERHHHPAIFIGHPLAEYLSPRKHHPAGKNVLLMPGSRSDEIRRIFPVLLAAAKKMQRTDPALRFHLVLADDVCLPWVRQQSENMTMEITVGDAHQKLRAADLALAASGTATLEAALLGVPMVVVYKMSPPSFWLAKSLLSTAYVALPNILSGERVVPELLQNAASAENIAEAGLKILSSDNRKMLDVFEKIHAKLQQNAGHNAACAILKLADG